jgi:hypothetical protein
VFPELYDKEKGSKGSTATYISSILKDLMPIVENEGKVTASLLWDSNITGTSLRRGSTQVMMRKVSMQAVVAKTGHDTRGSRSILMESILMESKLMEMMFYWDTEVQLWLVGHVQMNPYFLPL